MYQEVNTTPVENLDVLERLIEVRCCGIGCVISVRLGRCSDSGKRVLPPLYFMTRCLTGPRRHMPWQRRHALACKLGFPSYAHRFTADKMAGSPERVTDFLTSLAERVKVRVGGWVIVCLCTSICMSVYLRDLDTHDHAPHRRACRARPTRSWRCCAGPSSSTRGPRTSTSGA